MFTRKFWADTGERAVATAAQALVALLGVGALDLLTVSWAAVGATAAGAGLLSVLKSLAASRVGYEGSASLLPDDQYPSTTTNPYA